MKTKKPEPGMEEFLGKVQEKLEVRSGKLIWTALGMPVDLEDSRRVLVGSRKYPAEKIAWMLHTGEWPSSDIGFKNGISTDFRMSNLFQVITDKQVAITKSGDLFVVSNGSEQVMTTEVLGDAVQMVRSIFEG